jgi:NADH-quinone oxidoreductase subunit J
LTFYDIIFYVLAALTIFSAGTAVFSQKKSNVIIGLCCTFTGISGLFCILSAVFIALIYLVLCTICLTLLFFFILHYSERSPNGDQKKEYNNLLFPVLLAGTVTALLAGVIASSKWREIPAFENNFSIGELSELIMTKYSLPLEITAVVILVVITGAFYMLRQEKY